MKAKKEAKERNKREWVKNATIIFLAIMLVLTFFSNTIMNYSLPQVATQYVESDSITAKIRGTGTVEASDPFEVKIAETRTVTSVKVKPGEEVEKGDVLLELEDKESDELIEARKNVDTLQLEFDQKIISEGVSVDMLAKIKSGQITSMTDMQTQLTTAQNKIKTINTSISSYEKTVATLEAQLKMLGYIDTSAEATAVTNAKTQVTNAEAATATAEANKGSAETALANAEASYNNYTAAQKAYTSAQTARASAEAAKTKALADASSLPAGMTQAAADEALANAEAELKAAITEENTAKAVLDKAGNYNDILNAYNNAKNAYNTAATAYSSAVSSQAAASNTLASAQLTLANKEDTSAEEKSINKQLATANASLATEQLNLATAEDAYKDLQTKYTNELVLANEYAQIIAAQEQLAELEEKAIGASIVAPISGKVSAISITAGQDTKPDEAVLTIFPSGKEKTVSITVTNEQARKVSVGAVAEVANAWYYDDISVTLIQIKADQNNPATNKVLVFSVQGDVNDGQSLDISVGDKSSNYELVVPNSAVREDKDGKYVLVVESKSSPLGNRYIAKRVNVEILASDDKKTAIKGDVESYAYVITTASKPIQAGDQVRFYE